MLKPKVADVTRPVFALLARIITLVKLIVCILVVATHLSACSGELDPVASDRNGVDNSPAIDSPGMLSSDALQAPAQPELIITAAPETLQLSWQVDANRPSANVYMYDKLLGEETLIQGNLSADTSSLSLDSRTASRAWHSEQFRVELCDDSDCVSSARVSLNTLVAATAKILRPSVFIEGERFAEYIAANHDASVVFATRPVQGAIQVFFHNQQQWVATPPVSLNLAASISIKAIDSSKSGNTLAALSTSDDASSSIHIIERLGEIWMPTATLPLPAFMTVDASSKIKLSANGDSLLVHIADSIVLLRRDSTEWVLESPIEPSLNATLKASTVNGQFDTIHLLMQQNGQLWLESYQPNANEQSQAINHEQPDAQPPLNEDQRAELPRGHLWQRVRRNLVQGVDAQDELQLVTNVDASIVIVAGWNNDIIEQRSPLIWRMSTIGDNTNSDISDIQIMDSLQAAPTTDSRARLRFSSSQALDSIVLGWQNSFGDTAEISTYTYRDSDRQWYRLLELPHELTGLAKQAFAHNVLLSADGETLLVTTPSGNASTPSNRVGELRVFR